MSRFDAAIVEGNHPQQAQVVAIMTELDKEKSITKVPHMRSLACNARCTSHSVRRRAFTRGAQGVVGTCAGVAPSWHKVSTQVQSA